MYLVKTKNNKGDTVTVAALDSYRGALEWAGVNLWDIGITEYWIVEVESFV